MPVTRADIAQHVATASSAAPRAASACSASPGPATRWGRSLQILSALPDRRYGHLYELWDCLPNVAADGAGR